MILLYAALSVGVFALAVVAYLAFHVLRAPVDNPRMGEVAGYIRESAKAFMRRQFSIISIPIALLSITLAISDVRAALSFLLGSILSLLAAYVGLRIAVEANVRTAFAATSSSHKAFNIAFSGGAITGLSVVSLSLIGVCSLYLLYGDPSPIISFGFGASLAALFAQLGGGIFTKAADIGADLVGKIEKRIPEDDPRNPAVIADLVGDNVGDCAGRGADLFESMSDDYITAMILGTLMIGQVGSAVMAFPFLLGASGLLSAILALAFMRLWRGGRPISKFNFGLFISSLFCILGSFIACLVTIGDLRIFYATVAGLVASLAVGIAVQYYTKVDGRVIKDVAEASKAGAALNVLTGLAYALQSPFMPIVFIAAAVGLAYAITGGSLYGVLGVNLGTDLAIGFIMSSDAFGPICDNAAGIAEMSQTHTVGLDELDALGNTTKAYTKAFASSSGMVSTMVMFITFMQLVNLSNGGLEILSPVFILGLLVGAALPFVFSSMAVKVTGRTAYLVVDEVRRQFKENPAILEGKAKPDYVRCVDLATKHALKGMVAPAMLAVIPPIIVGFFFGKYVLGGLLLGCLVASVLLSPFFIFGGGIWDNAKKYIEKTFWLKDTPVHAAAVTGDTVGDPLKDVAGPSLNIFMKLTAITALLILPLM
ncbi:sodium-translocating pyrophosphatase [Candidatus Bathyarchaeota archaeon]|nr:sodium-translocating pyrophosphatase [Candidatus Bathyarchaeota archaeon]